MKQDPIPLRRNFGVDRRRAWPGSWEVLVKQQELVILLLLVVVGTALAVITDTFLTPSNLFNVARAFSWIAIAAFGETLVIIIGGLDLSIGSVMVLAGLVCATCLQAGLPVALAVGAGLLVGGGVGLTNGVIIGVIGLQPVVVTLGTLSLASGIAYGLNGGAPVQDLPWNFRRHGQYDLPLGPWLVPLPVLYMLALAALMSLLLRRTVLGRYIYTLGSNERALLVSGVDTARIKILVYTVCGLLAAVGGLLMTARLGVASTSTTRYEFEIIAAAVIGGASLRGGEGSILGALLGTAMIQVLRNGLVLLGFPSYWETGTMGAMILFVLLLDYWRRRRARS